MPKQLKAITLILVIFVTILNININRLGFEMDERATIDCASGISNGVSMRFLHITTGISIKKYQKQRLNLKVFTQQDYAKYNTLGNVIQATIDDNGNAVSYNILLHYWKNAFGIGYVRYLNMLLATLTLFLILYIFNKYISTNVTSLFIVGFLYVFHGIIFFININVRGYPLGILASVTLGYLILKSLHQKVSIYQFALMGVVIGIGLLSHYFFAFAALFWFVFLLVFYFAKNKQLANNIIYYGIPFIIGAIFLFTWLYVSADGVAHMQQTNKAVHDNVYAGKANWIWGLNRITLSENIKWIYFVFSSNFGYNSNPYSIINNNVISIFLFIGFLLYLNKHIENKLIISFNYTLIIVSAIAIAAFSFVGWSSGHTLIFIRFIYLSFLIPYIIISIGFILDRSIFDTKINIIVKALGLLLGIYIFVGYLDNFNFVYIKNRNEKVIPNYFDKAANTIIEKYQPGDTIQYSNWDDALYTNYYLNKTKTILQKVEETDNHLIFLKKGSQISAIYNLNNQR
jgi:hypothetical protein